MLRRSGDRRRITRKYLKVESFLKKVLTRLLLGISSSANKATPSRSGSRRTGSCSTPLTRRPRRHPHRHRRRRPTAFCTPAPAPAPAPAGALTTVRVSTQITLDGVVAAFNYDGGQRAAFALAVLDSAIHFDDIIDIGARREAGWPPAKPVPGVVSFTGIAHIYDVEDPAEIASSALMQSMDSLTEALTDGAS